MTDKLSDELRKLADKMPKIIRYGSLLSDERRDYDCPAANGLRRAADALDYLTEVVENFGQADKSAGLLMEQAKNKAVERAERAEARVARLEEALNRLQCGDHFCKDKHCNRVRQLISELGD